MLFLFLNQVRDGNVVHHKAYNRLSLLIKFVELQSPMVISVLRYCREKNVYISSRQFLIEPVHNLINSMIAYDIQLRYVT